MSTRSSGRHGLARRLGTVGAVVGVAAGLIQITVGSRIPAWTGAKDATTALGLLTVALSVLAGLAAVRQSRPELSPLARAGWAVGLIGPGLLCLSTVGRLWYLPAVLLVAAGWLAIDSWQETAAALVENWHRVLLSVLGGLQLPMAAGASPALMVIGGLGGVALIAAAWLPTTSRALVGGLVVVGTVPFAVLGATAVVPVLVAVMAGWLTVFAVRGRSADAH